MEISKNKEKKMICIWMSNADQQDKACQRQAKETIGIWHAKGWLPVVFCSGDKDLKEMTSALLVNNRNRSARRAAERQLEENKSSVCERLNRSVNRERKAHTVKKSMDDICI